MNKRRECSENSDGTTTDYTVDGSSSGGHPAAVFHGTARILAAGIVLGFFTLLPMSLFAEAETIDFEKLEEGRYICRYEEHYYDGVGESVFTLKRISGGYKAVWDGISDSTTVVYADENFRTQGVTMTSDTMNLRLERQGDRIHVSGWREGKEVEKSMKLESPRWFQILPLSLIGFTTSAAREVEFSLFDPFNIKMRNMKISKKGSETVELFGKEYRATKLNMRMRGFLSPFWKSEIWISTSTGTHLKYEGVNVEPKRYKSKIYLKSVEFVPD